jgi:hypothetical protein
MVWSHRKPAYRQRARETRGLKAGTVSSILSDPAKIKIALSAIILGMDGEYEDLSHFLMRYGFSEKELSGVIDELNSYRSIPGTTVHRYTNRIINTIDEGDRTAFLKGIMVGMVIRKAADALQEQDQTDEERRIIR